MENHADEISIWQKQQGTWESITWGEYGDFVKDIANALVDAGIEWADKVSIIIVRKIISSKKNKYFLYFLSKKL